MNEVKEEEFPWTFYFNGVEMPKWGACWELAELHASNDAEKTWDWDVGPRDIYIIGCRIDHVGVPESADPGVFRYVVQEVIAQLLDDPSGILDRLKRNWKIAGQCAEIYQGLIEAAFQMRELTMRDAKAFWTTGNETDRQLLLEAMRRSCLAPDHPDFARPPHIQAFQRELEFLRNRQAKRLRRIAASGRLSKDLRTRLLDVWQSEH